MEPENKIEELIAVVSIIEINLMLTKQQITAPYQILLHNISVLLSIKLTLMLNE